MRKNGHGVRMTLGGSNYFIEVLPEAGDVTKIDFNIIKGETTTPVIKI
jgi:hypothetical protein